MPNIFIHEDVNERIFMQISSSSQFSVQVEGLINIPQIILVNASHKKHAHKLINYTWKEKFQLWLTFLRENFPSQ